MLLQKKSFLICGSCMVLDKRKEPIIIVVMITTERKSGRNGSDSRVILFLLIT